MKKNKSMHRGYSINLLSSYFYGNRHEGRIHIQLVWVRIMVLFYAGLT